MLEGVLVEYERMDGSPANPPTNESDCLLDLDIVFQFGESETLLPLACLNLFMCLTRWSRPSLPLPLPLQTVSPLYLGRTLSDLRCGLADCPLFSGPPPLQLQPAPPSLSLYDNFLSCQLNFSRSTAPLPI